MTRLRFDREVHKTHEEYLAAWHKADVRTLRRIKAAIDEVFGEGYAAKNPTLVGAMWQGESTEEIAQELSEGLGSMTVYLNDGHGGELSLSDVAEAIDRVARAIEGAQLDARTLVDAGECLIEEWRNGKGDVR